MRSFDIETSCSSLIYLTSLTDDIVIPDISPSSCTCVIRVNSTYECRIIRILIKVLCCMMDDDSVYFFCCFGWPDELFSILIPREGDKVCSTSPDFPDTLSSLEVLLASIPFLFCFIDDKRCLPSCFPFTFFLLKQSLIPKTNTLIRSPLAPRDDRWISLSGVYE